MIWVIGNRGLIGTDVEIYIRSHVLPAFFTDKEIDITNIDALKAFCSNKKIDWIINCAGFTSIDRAETSPVEASMINSLGAENIAIVAKEINAKLIHISCDQVFGGEKDEYSEFDVPYPKSAYGNSKRVGEVNISHVYDKVFIIRTSWVFGKFGNNFVFSILKLILSKCKIIQVVDDQTGSPTYSKDLAEGIMRIIEQNLESYGIYHFSNRGKTDWFEFAKKIYSLAVIHRRLERWLQAFVTIEPITTSEYVTIAPRPQNSYLSTKKFEETFSYSIRRWDIALEDFILSLPIRETRPSGK